MDISLEQKLKRISHSDFEHKLEGREEYEE
jgi:hypothetical protein